MTAQREGAMYRPRSGRGRLPVSNITGAPQERSIQWMLPGGDPENISRAGQMSAPGGSMLTIYLNQSVKAGGFALCAHTIAAGTSGAFTAKNLFKKGGEKMKKIKKIASILLAAIMVIAMAVPTMAGSITIQNTTPGHKYTAYQIFKGTVSKDESILSNIQWGANVSDAFKEMHGEGAAKYADTLNKAEESEAVALADLLAKNKTTYLTGDAKSISEVNAADGYEITELDPGYYLIIDESTGDVISAYMMEIVGEVKANPKTGEPTFEKKVQDINDSTETDQSDLQDSADYDIGDDVPYTLTITLPTEYARFKEYYLKVTDEMAEGLTLNESSFKMAYEGTDITNVIELSKYIKKTDNGFTIEIEDLKTLYPAAEANGKIVITYTAKLNNNAKLGDTGNENKANLTYSRNPNWTGEGTPDDTKTTPDDTVIVFTYDAIVNKVDGTEEHKPLPGADFDLQKWNGTAWENVDPSKKTTLDDGTKFNFKGLDDGYYRLHESKTPDGYNSIEDMYFEIAAKHTQNMESEETDNPKLTEFEVYDLKVDESGAPQPTGEKSPKAGFTAVKEFTENTISTDVVNQEGTTLPETGGIGTTIFYVIGAILVIGAGVLLVTKKRTSAK